LCTAGIPFVIIGLSVVVESSRRIPEPLSDFCACGLEKSREAVTSKRHTFCMTLPLL